LHCGIRGDIVHGLAKEGTGVRLLILHTAD